MCFSQEASQQVVRGSENSQYNWMWKYTWETEKEICFNKAHHWWIRFNVSLCYSINFFSHVDNLWVALRRLPGSRPQAKMDGVSCLWPWILGPFQLCVITNFNVTFKLQFNSFFGIVKILYLEFILEKESITWNALFSIVILDILIC